MGRALDRARNVPVMPAVDRLTVYPVKGLDGLDVETAAVREGGTLAHDREFALLGPDGERWNGKQSAGFHRLATTYDPGSAELLVEPPSAAARTFDLDAPDGRDRAATWFSEYFDADLELARDRSVGYVDRQTMGPSVVSTATLEAVASWFDDLTVDGARRRLRANVEIGGVEPFWEDRLVGDGAPSFRAGGVRFDGVTPCGRCVVPTRDPDTGDPLPGFRERFVAKRRETFPEWADRDAFDHCYSLMVIASVPERDRGETVAVGDTVSLVDE